MRCRVSVTAIVTLALFAGVFPVACSAEPSAGGNSSIQQKFDAYWKLINSPRVWEQGNYQLAGTEYDKLFSGDQNETEVQALDAKDLRLLFHAAEAAAFYTWETRYVRDMTLDLAEMQERGGASNADYRDMYKALVNTRMFPDARKFYAAHPSAGLTPLPAYRDEARGAGDNVPTVLVLSTEKYEMTRRPVELGGPAQVVVLVDPLCHFSANFLQALQPHPKLREVFEHHAVWLAPPDSVFQFDTLQKWNRAHPEEPIVIMYRPADWPMIKVLGVPRFYFLKDGQPVTKVIGWPKGGNFDELEKALKQIGLGQPVASKP